MALRRVSEKKHDRPQLLNEKIRVHSYDGGSFKNRTQYQVKNVLTPTLEPFHCSGQGQGPYNLVLKMVQGAEFTLTHMYLLGPGKKCTEPIKSALIFITNELPDVGKSKFYDTLSTEEIQEYIDGKEFPTGDEIPTFRPCLHFTTDKETREVEHEFPKWVSGSYVLVKFMSTHNSQENMDVGVVGLVGYSTLKTQPEDCELFGKWLHRSVLSPFIHCNQLKSMFSSSGWVCDGRDSSGGCRSGQTDFHQTSVHTVTFRCSATGLDLCESCAYDPTLGIVTAECARTDMQELKDSQTCKLITGRIRNALRHNWRKNLPTYMEQDFLNTLITLLETNSIPGNDDGNRSAREQGRLPKLRGGFHFHQRPQLTADAQRKVMRKALFQILNDIHCVIFGLTASPDFLIGEMVWAREVLETSGDVPMQQSSTEGYQEARVFKLSSTKAEELEYQVTWAHHIKPSTFKGQDIWKIQKEDMISETLQLHEELKKGPDCDVEEVKRLLGSKADPSACDGLGETLLYKAIKNKTKKEVIDLFLEHGACVDCAVYPNGETSLDAAEEHPDEEIKKVLEENNASRSGNVNGSLQEEADTLRHNVLQTVLLPLLQLVEKVAKGSVSDERGTPSMGIFIQSDKGPEVLEAVCHLLNAAPIHMFAKLVKEDRATFIALKRMLETFVLQDTAPSVCNCMKIANYLVQDETLKNLVLSIGAREWTNTILARAAELSKTETKSLDDGAKLLTSLSQQITEEAKKLIANLGDQEPLAVVSLIKLIEEIKNATSWKVKTNTFQQLIDRLTAEEKIEMMHESCSSYELSKADGPKVILEMLEAPQGPEFFSELLNKQNDAAKKLVSTILGVIELGEVFSVWRYKKDKGVKSLVDPITLKLKYAGDRVCTPATNASFSTAVEPLTSIQELSKYLLSITPVQDLEFLRYCHELIGAEISLSDTEKGEEEEWDVVAFEIATDCIPLPIHTIARVVDGTRKEQKVLLTIRDYIIKKGSSPDEVQDKDREIRSQIALCKIMLQPEDFQQLLREPSTFDIAAMCTRIETKQKEEKDAELAAASTDATAAATGDNPAPTTDTDATMGDSNPTISEAYKEKLTELLSWIQKNSSEKEVFEVINEELARLASRDGIDKQTDNGQVDPNARVHTVMMTVGEDLPFDLIWQMTKDDIHGAMREICPRGVPQPEEAIQAGIAANGMGPIAKGLTLREAENLSSRLGHCIQTAVTIDQAALEKERAREKASTTNLALSLGSRVKFSKIRGSEESLVGVLIGIHDKDQRFTLMEAQTGIIHDSLPRTCLKSASERRDRWETAEILSQSDLIRLRDHLRRRVEVDRNQEGGDDTAGGSATTGTGGGWRVAIGDLVNMGNEGGGARFGAPGGGPLILRLPGSNADVTPGNAIREDGSGGNLPAYEPTDLEESESDSERSAVEMIHQILEEDGEIDESEMARLNEEEADGPRTNDEEMRDTPHSDGDHDEAMIPEQVPVEPPATIPVAVEAIPVPVDGEEEGRDNNRMMEQLRLMEEVFQNDLGVNMNGLRFRLGLPGPISSNDNTTTRFGSFARGGSSSGLMGGLLSSPPSTKRPIPKAPLRTRFAAFLRASDSTNPTATLDHPVNQRLSPQDLLKHEPLVDDDDTAQTAVNRAVITPKFGLLEDKPTTDVTKDWTLIRAMQHMFTLGYKAGRSERGNPKEKVPLEEWGLTYELQVQVPPRPWNFDVPAKKRRKIAATQLPVNDEVERLSLDCLPHVRTCISLLGQLHSLATPACPAASSSDAAAFVCHRLDRKLRCQLDDPLAIASGTVPVWSKVLPLQYPFLFSQKTRKLMMKYCGFGLSYCVHWMQDQRLGSFLRRRVALQTDLNTASDPRKIQELSQELSNVEEHVVRSAYWLGGLQTSIIKLEKGESFLIQAINGLEALCAPESVIHTVEVQFENETGFGTGVTQSFYTEVANALISRKENQKNPMWVDDDHANGDHVGQRARRGLLIRPMWNADTELLRRFRFLGALVGKALREGFIVPLPLSEEFFALAKGDINLTVDHLPRPGDGYSGEFVGACADFLAAYRRNETEAKTLNFPERFLMREKNAADQSDCVTFDDYCSLSCASFLETGFDGANLDGEGDLLGDSRSLTVETLGDFVDKAVNFWFRTGVKKQVEAFRKGLGSMLDLEHLYAFTPAELKEMICGSETIEWDRQTLENHVHPTNGLTRDSSIYKFLIDVMLDMKNEDRARFLDFVSSCPRLLPGGKFYMDVCPAPKTQKYPRSRACANQLYLPEYSTKEELQQNLFEAMYSSVGHHEQRLTRDL